MRIHTDTLTISDIYAAASKAGVGLERDTEHGSRKRKRAFDVILTGDSPYRINQRGWDNPHAATWDQWGIFLAELFRRDKDMIGGWAYADARDFHQKTYQRFNVRTGITSPSDRRYHRVHRFEWTGYRPECTCGAAR